MKKLLLITMMLMIALALPLIACTPAAAPLVDAPAWFQLDDAAPESDVLLGYRLRAGRIGAQTTVDIALPAEAFASGPVGPDGALILFGDGRRIETVDVIDGTRTLLVQANEDQVLRRAVLGAIDLFVFALDRATREELGVFRFPAAVGQDGRAWSLDEGERVLGPMPAGHEAIGPTFATILALTDDGMSLVAQSCGEILCRARVLSLDDGRVFVRDELGQGEIIGVDDGKIIAWEAGNGWPCKVLSIDARTGAADELAFAYGATLARDASGAPTLVFESGDDVGVIKARALRAPPDDGAPIADRPLAVLGESSVSSDDALHPLSAMALAGIAVPDGLVALGFDGRAAAPHQSPHAFVIRIDDGALFETR